MHKMPLRHPRQPEGVVVVVQPPGRSTCWNWNISILTGRSASSTVVSISPLALRHLDAYFHTPLLRRRYRSNVERALEKSLWSFVTTQMQPLKTRHYSRQDIFPYLHILNFSHTMQHSHWITDHRAEWVNMLAVVVIKLEQKESYDHSHATTGYPTTMPLSGR